MNMASLGLSPIWGIHIVMDRLGTEKLHTLHTTEYAYGSIYPVRRGQLGLSENKCAKQQGAVPQCRGSEKPVATSALSIKGKEHRGETLGSDMK